MNSPGKNRSALTKERWFSVYLTVDGEPISRNSFKINLQIKKPNTSSGLSKNDTPIISAEQTNFCANRVGNQVPFSILIQSDSKPQENSFKLKLHKKGQWVERMNKSLRRKNTEQRYDKCLFFKRCYIFELFDEAGDGIDGGYYRIFFKDDEVAYSKFDGGYKAITFGGINCASDSPSTVPSVSAAPSISIAPTLAPVGIRPTDTKAPTADCALSYGNKVLLNLLIQTDSKPEENSFNFSYRNKDGEWLQRLTNAKLGKNELNEFSMCIHHKRCFRFELYDTASDGITGGYYKIYLNDTMVVNSQFDNGSEMVTVYGDECESDIPSEYPTALPSIAPSTSPTTSKPTNKPSGFPSISPTLTPSLSSGPSSSPSVSYIPTGSPTGSSQPSISNAPSHYCDPKPGTQVPFSIFITTDSKPEETKFKLSIFKEGIWMQIMSRNPPQFKADAVNRFDKCLFFKRCFKLEIYDQGGDGLDNGGYSIIFNGEEVANNEFDSGYGVVQFGGANCKRDNDGVDPVGEIPNEEYY